MGSEMCIRDRESLVEDGYERTNVWKFPPDTRSKHPAPYPTALSDRIIKYYSYKHDLVLDPFMGSVTTAVSAKSLDRRFVGCEIHEAVSYTHLTLPTTLVV